MVIKPGGRRAIGIVHPRIYSSKPRVSLIESTRNTSRRLSSFAHTKNLSEVPSFFRLEF
jgi:hypothetical protein